MTPSENWLSLPTGDPKGPLYEIIDRISLVPANPRDWPAVLDKIAEALGASAGLLVLEDLSASAPSFWSASSSYRTQFKELYFPRFRINPLLLAAKDLPCPSIARTEQLPGASFRESEMYRECLAPVGFAHAIGANLFRQGSEFGYLSFWRTAQQGPYSDEELIEFGRLVPHFVRAVRLQRALSKQYQTQNATLEMLRAMVQPVFVLTEDGTLEFSNPAGNELLDDGGLLRRQDARLVVSADPDVGVFDLLCRQAQEDTASTSPDRCIERRLTLSATSGKSYGLHLVSSFCRHEYWPGEKRYLLLTVSDPDLQLAQTQELWGRELQLTHAEIKVAEQLVNGRSPAEIAVKLAVSISTVRTHLAHLFDKTSTGRQAELVAQLLAFSASAL